MARRIRDYDWSATPLGPRDGWSRGLKTALDLCLGSRMCSSIYWGPARLLLYNDAYSAILGARHPGALGRPADEVWPEIIDVIGPLMQRTLETGETTGADDAPIFLNRSGYVEEFYCSFSYSPLVNEFGDTEGVFTMFPETTVRVIGERRLRTLQQVGSQTREVRDPAAVLEAVAGVVADNARDLPFAAFYLWNDDRSEAHLCATANVDAGSPLAPRAIGSGADLPLAQLVSDARADDPARLRIRSADGPVPRGAWQVPAEMLLALPFVAYGEGAPQAFMLAGMNPHKRLDRDYRRFLGMFADHVSRALAEAYSHEQEDARLNDLRERARVAQQEERVRIARDLHDTLLQSMQGMRFLLEAALARSRAGDASALGLYENALDASVHAIDEGREVLSLLRYTAPPGGKLATALATLGEDIVRGSRTTFSLDVAGEQKPLGPALWNDIYGICREAVANAVRHAQASRITIDVSYGEDLRVSIEDDGCGMPGDVAATGRAGHFGLQGMRERSRNIGGELAVISGQARGTRIVLTVPGATAFQA